MRLTLAAGALLWSTLAWAGPMTAVEPELAPDWSLSDQELFEVIEAETSTSTVGHERSIREGPAGHSDADDPGPEFPTPDRSTASAETLVKGRVAPTACIRPAVSRLTAPVPLRL